MIDAYGNLKMIDFGSAKKVENLDEPIEDLGSTAHMSAPGAFLFFDFLYCCPVLSSSARITFQFAEFWIEQQDHQHQIYTASQQSMSWAVVAQIVNVLSTEPLDAAFDRAEAYRAWDKKAASFSLNQFLGARYERIDPKRIPMPPIFTRNKELSDLYATVILPGTNPKPQERPTIDMLYEVRTVISHLSVFFGLEVL